MNPVGDRDRTYWRCRRGMLELDLLLQGFLQRGLDDLDAAGLAAFDRLLDYPDATLLELLMGRMNSSDREVDDVIRRIRDAVRVPA
ncbi:MAG: succinate dehydrogenase assembly factor 2 [Chromatiales bacterium]|nr:succinate dehydrogenase assembly factor 2 [Chromatiales bacterium]MDX9766766.1 succinate dehydrogenase assembly factor 2 [Ectothiorhodospiraceae bacterium]